MNRGLGLQNLQQVEIRTDLGWCTESESEPETKRDPDRSKGPSKRKVYNRSGGRLE